MKKSKYNSRKITRNGITFDSIKESERWEELLLLERAGVISKLQRQVVFPLLPAQRELSSETYRRGRKKGMYKEGKTIEKAVTYTADFCYWRDGEPVIEDVKGIRTKDYIIKRKMMLYFHGIKIKEI